MSLIVKDLCVELQKHRILKEINLQIEEGAFISLLGASGCGKTTFLKSISGLLEVQSGDILLNERSITEVPPQKRGTVVVFQDLRLFPHMTVGRNVAFPMELKKVPKEKQQQTVERLLAAVQLAGFEKRKVRELSGGQLQRIALARALAAEPKVLLLDEPFSGLHDSLRTEMRALVKRLHQEHHLTTILVTHDREEALQMSDKIALMKDGQILQYDVPRIILNHPVSPEVAAYFGEVTYVNGTVSHGQFAGTAFAAKADLADGDYEAAVLSKICYFRKKEGQDEKDTV